MRRTIAALLSAAVAAFAVTASGPSGHQLQANPGCSVKGALGVARTVEIDAQAGPRYGQQQYPDNADLLADGEVVLTFDDGPLRPHTSRIMQALDRHCTKATFFMVGSQALADPQMVKDLAARGHTIGTHTWSHQFQLRKTNFGRAEHEIELGFSAVRQALGAPVAPFFRFPFLSDSRAALEHLRSRGIATFSIDVDSLDYRQKGPDRAERVFSKVMSDLAYRRKGIILFHDIQPSTAEALPRILDALKARGFRVVHLAAKAPASTVARFDQQMQSEAGRRRIAVAARPLSPRAVTWPMPQPATTGDGKPQGPPGYLPNDVPPPGVRPGSRDGLAIGGPAANALPAVAAPAQPASTSPAPASAPATAAPRRSGDEPDWRSRAFGTN